MRITTFLDSPANRAGLSALAATAVTALLQYLATGHVPMTDVFGVVLAAGLILVPDNTVTVAQLEKAVADAAMAWTTKSPAAVGAVITDAEGIAAAVVKTETKGA